MLPINTVTRASEESQWRSWLLSFLLLAIGVSFAILVTDSDKKVGVIQFPQKVEFIISYWTLCFFCLGYGMLRIFLGSALDKALHSLVMTIILVTSVILALLVVAPLVKESYLLQILILLLYTLLALLPFSLYISFLSIKRKPLQDELIFNLSRIYSEHKKSVFQEVKEIYRIKFERMFGQEPKKGSSYVLPEFQALLPIILATMLMSLGWFYTATSVNPYIICLVLRKSTCPAIDINPIVCGFLGAYLFSMSFLFRRYVQSDLGPVAYSNVNLRLITTFIWSVLLWKVEDAAYVGIFTFAVGVFPDVGWQWLFKRLQSVTGSGIPDQSKNYQLNQISGITIWVESRLLEEDIENVQNLATANLPELLLQTNYPPDRLVNWIDEAILQTHLVAYKKKPEDNATTVLEYLKLNGITTASGFLGYYYKNHPQAESEALARLASEIENEANLSHIKAWHEANSVQLSHCLCEEKDDLAIALLPD